MPGSHNLVVRMPGKHVVARPYGFRRPLEFSIQRVPPKNPIPGVPFTLKKKYLVNQWLKKQTQNRAARNRMKKAAAPPGTRGRRHESQQKTSARAPSKPPTSQ